MYQITSFGALWNVLAVTDDASKFGHIQATQRFSLHNRNLQGLFELLCVGFYYP